MNERKSEGTHKTTHKRLNQRRTVLLLMLKSLKTSLPGLIESGSRLVLQNKATATFYFVCACTTPRVHAKGDTVGEFKNRG